MVDDGHLMSGKYRCCANIFGTKGLRFYFCYLFVYFFFLY